MSHYYQSKKNFSAFETKCLTVGTIPKNPVVTTKDPFSSSSYSNSPQRHLGLHIVARSHELTATPQCRTPESALCNSLPHLGLIFGGEFSFSPSPNSN
ncbi:hypothetical protein GmHk_14G041987 [Glycine max]|nr:hypothetical protein GmHk_14G041987 [Glycine max]